LRKTIVIPLLLEDLDHRVLYDKLRRSHNQLKVYQRNKKVGLSKNSKTFSIMAENLKKKKEEVM